MKLTITDYQLPMHYRLSVINAAAVLNRQSILDNALKIDKRKLKTA